LVFKFLTLERLKGAWETQEGGERDEGCEKHSFSFLVLETKGSFTLLTLSQHVFQVPRKEKMNIGK